VFSSLLFIEIRAIREIIRMYANALGELVWDPQQKWIRPPCARAVQPLTGCSVEFFVGSFKLRMTCRENIFLRHEYIPNITLRDEGNFTVPWGAGLTHRTTS
jgi:hypothetical protein